MKYPLSLLLLCLTVSLSAQDFQGKITYVNSYYSKKLGINDLQWGAMMGNRSEYFYKEGNYLVKLNGSLTQGQQYVHNLNSIFNTIANSDSLYCIDAIENRDSVLKIVVNKDVVDVMGYRCDEMIMTTKTGVHKYYYSSRFGVNPKLFAKHKFGNWAAYTKVAKAFPLKMIIETPQYTFESFAIKTEYYLIDSKFFELKPRVSIAAQPF